MSEGLLLSVAVFVFAMLAIGLGLTIWEFSRGEPPRDETQTRRDHRLGQD